MKVFYGPPLNLNQTGLKCRVSQQQQVEPCQRGEQKKSCTHMVYLFMGGKYVYLR